MIDASEYEARFYPDRERKGKKSVKFTERGATAKILSRHPKKAAFVKKSCINKKRFDDEERAKIFCKHLKKKLDDQNVQMRAYDCNLCGGWHLTKTQNQLTEDIKGDVPDERIDQSQLS